MIKAAFPKAKLVALPAAVAEIKKTAAGKVKQWAPMYGALVTSKPVQPTTLATPRLTLEGQTITTFRGPNGREAAADYRRVVDEMLRDWPAAKGREA